MGKEHRRTNIQTYFISSLAITESLIEYGISSIFILFLLHVLHFSVHLSSSTYSQYYLFAYTLPIFVGFISDRYLTKSRSITIGFASMIISQFLLYLSSSMYYQSPVEYTSLVFNPQNILFIAGLIFLGIGTSFTTNMLSKIISLISDESTNSKIDSYSIYYAFINLGVIIGILIMTFIVGDSNYFLYQKAFLTFTVILVIGLIVFLWGKNRFLGEYIEDISEKTHSNEDNGKFLENI